MYTYSWKVYNIHEVTGLLNFVTHTVHVPTINTSTNIRTLCCLIKCVCWL